MRTKGLLPRYHLCSLEIADQHAHHPDQHQAHGLSDQGQGFAVTGCPCRSTLSYFRTNLTIIDFFGRISGRHSVRDVCGGSQLLATPSLSAPPAPTPPRESCHYEDCVKIITIKKW